MTYVLGLTGGIATGKSTAASYFRQQGFSIVDADQISKQVLATDASLQQILTTRFGEDIMTGQVINRQKLGQLIFHNQAARQFLNQQVHPLVRAVTLERIEAAKRQNERLIILDVPLLFEAGFDRLCDGVMVVTVSPAVQLARLMIRNNLTQAQAKARIDAQMPLAQKVRQATYVIHNEESLENLHQQLNEWLSHKGFTTKA